MPSPGAQNPPDDGQFSANTYQLVRKGINTCLWLCNSVSLTTSQWVTRYIRVIGVHIMAIMRVLAFSRHLRPSIGDNSEPARRAAESDAEWPLGVLARVIPEKGLEATPEPPVSRDGPIPVRMLPRKTRPPRKFAPPRNRASRRGRDPATRHPNPLRSLCDFFELFGFSRALFATSNCALMYFVRRLGLIRFRCEILF